MTHHGHPLTNLLVKRDAARRATGRRHRGSGGGGGRARSGARPAARRAARGAGVSGDARRSCRPRSAEGELPPPHPRVARARRAGRDPDARRDLGAHAARDVGHVRRLPGRDRRQRGPARAGRRSAVGRLPHLARRPHRARGRHAGAAGGRGRSATADVHARRRGAVRVRRRPCRVRRRAGDRRARPRRPLPPRRRAAPSPRHRVRTRPPPTRPPRSIRHHHRPPHRSCHDHARHRPPLRARAHRPGHTRAGLGRDRERRRHQRLDAPDRSGPP